MASCYAFEARGIQRYILATAKLREMVGASELVEDLCTRKLEQALEEVAGPGGWRIVSRAAGGARIVIDDDEDARIFYATWPFVVSRVAPGLQISQALVSGPVEESILTLEGALRAQRSFPLPELPQAAPPVRTNPRTGQASSVLHKGEAVELAIERKLAAADHAQQRLREDLAPGESSWRWALDITELTAQDAERGYVAVVHADGNALGLAIRQIHSAAAGSGRLADVFAAFSAGVSEATKEAAKLATSGTIAGTFDPHNEAVPFRPVVLGGDDLTVIIRAELALPFTEMFLEAFETKSQECLTRRFEGFDGGLRKSLPTQLTACAGIVYVRPKYPFSLAHQLADDLCSHAKDRSKAARGKNGDPVPSSLAFHRVTSALTGSYQQVRERELTGFEVLPNENLTLTGGPWGVGNHSAALRSLRALRELTACLLSPSIPRGPVRQLVTELHHTPGEALRLFERFREVLSEEAGKRLDGALDSLLPSRQGVWSAEPQPDFWTPWCDAVALAAIEGRKEP